MRTSARWLALFVLSFAWGPPIVHAEAASGPQSDQVTIADVKVRISDHGPVVLLQAVSIQGALNGEQLHRPLSHDLMHTILDTFGAKVTQSVITLKGGTYYGALSVSFRGDVKVFDSRSSDSIALAIHFKAPINVGRDLLNSAGVVPEEPKPQDL